MRPRSKLTFFAAAAIAAMVLLAGCVTASVEQLRRGEAPIAAKESVVILSRGNKTGVQAEESFLECFNGAFTERMGGVDIYPQQQFIDSLYPWFEPARAPEDVASFAELLRDPQMQEALDITGVRYMIWVDGHTQESQPEGGISCGATPGFAGCLGVTWWDRESAYEAQVWDLRQMRTTGLVSSEASGTSYIPALIVPLPLLARTQGPACQGLADQVGALFSPGTNPEAPDDDDIEKSPSTVATIDQPQGEKEDSIGPSANSPAPATPAE